MKIDVLMEQANGVLRELRKLDAPAWATDVCVDTYKNGRERGYAVTFYGHDGMGGVQIAFAENRGSDDIIIYAGRSGEFDMAGNVPNDRIYEERIYSEPYNYAKAAKAVVKAAHATRRALKVAV